MAYIKSKQDVEELKEFFARPEFIAEALSVEFTTTPEFVREALPPCFTPLDTPTGYVSIARYQSSGMGEFPCGWVFLGMSYNGAEGIFPIASYFGEQNHTSWIREVWGEPGKVAHTGLFEDGDYKSGYSHRQGARIIEIDADLGPEQITSGPTREESHYFELKMVLSSKDGGFEFDPIAIKMDVDEEVTSYRTGEGSIALRNSPFDPLGEIPVLAVGEATWKVSRSRYELTAYDSQSDHEAYLPYAYADRYWDDPRKLPIPRRFKK